ncbi:MAG: phosphoribosyltransferase family protein [Candidatus Binataceae bacterium]
MQRLPKYDVISIDDLSISEIERIFVLADEFAAQLETGERLHVADGLIMATLFYEPSTRTRLSFESAAHRLGGSVISSASMDVSSAAKGETLADTVRVVSGYADLIVIRHPFDGAAQVAADYARCTVINAGDGSREHPTQTLCDLYILRKKKGHLRGLTVAICGDLKFGRTVHSLIYALARFGANVVAVPNRGMGVPNYVLARLAAERNYSFSTVSISELKTLAGGLDAMYLTPSAPHQMALFTGDMPVISPAPASPGPGALDAFYVTRFQRERRSEQERDQPDYVRFDARALRTSRTQEAVVMHPLPRTDELSYELDTDPRAVYFEQAAAGVPVRMALIGWLLENAGSTRIRAGGPKPLTFKAENAPTCANPSCISRHESRYLRPRFRMAPAFSRAELCLRCEFCERELKVQYVGHSRSRRYYKFDESLIGYVRQWLEDGTMAVFETVKQAEEAGYEPYRRGPQREIMNAEEIARAVEAMAAQIIRDLPDLARVSVVGIVSHGALLALRLCELIEQHTKVRIPCAALDVFRGFDALQPLGGAQSFEVEDRIIVLTDDVINSGWTVQRAMTTLWKLGRPAGVRLAVLVDRGHRALPIRPNYVGKNVPTARNERVQVRLGDAVEQGAGRPADRVMVYSMVESLKEAGENA